MSGPAAALALLLAAGAPVPGPEAPTPRPLSFLSRAERSEVRLGEPFAYAIEVRHAAGERYALEAAALDAPPFRGDGGACRRAGAGDDVRTTCTLRLALFDLGPHDVPEVRLRVSTAAGEALLAVPGPRVTGVGLADPAAPPGSLRLRDPAPPVPLLVPTWAPLLWGLGAAGAALAALAAARAWRRRGRAAAAPPPPVPPEVRFAARVDALLARGLLERGDARELFFELSAALREWLGAVTGLPALDLTTAELVERLEAAADPRVDAAAVRAFCERADLVKFARAAAAPAERREAVERARGIVGEST